MGVMTASIPPQDGPFQDWEDWKPVWTESSASHSPHRHQERHSPTESVAVRRTGSRQVETGRRRLLDSRLWDAMTPPQQDAACEIERAVTALSRGLGFRISATFRFPVTESARSAAPSSTLTDRQAEYIHLYFTWAREMEKDGLSHAAVLDVLVFGESCRAVDRARRMRNGWARRNLLAGMVLYCTLRGWPAA